MKWFIALMAFLMCTFAFFMGAFVAEQSQEIGNKESLQDQKTRLEIEVLKHELAIYKEQDEIVKKGKDDVN